jgi:hypothetical protein
MIDAIDHRFSAGSMRRGLLKREQVQQASRCYAQGALSRQNNQLSDELHRSCRALPVGTIDTVAHGHGKLPFFAVPATG